MKKYLGLLFLAACGNTPIPGACLEPTNSYCVEFANAPKQNILQNTDVKWVCENSYNGIYLTQACGTGAGYVGKCQLPSQGGVVLTYFLYGDTWTTQTASEVCANSKGVFTNP